MKKLKFHKWKKLKIQKWREWKATYEKSIKPQMKKLKIHKWRNWKSIIIEKLCGENVKWFGCEALENSNGDGTNNKVVEVKETVWGFSKD